jgi:hypothetical protein
MLHRNVTSPKGCWSSLAVSAEITVEAKLSPRGLPPVRRAVRRAEGAVFWIASVLWFLVNIKIGTIAHSLQCVNSIVKY